MGKKKKKGGRKKKKSALTEDEQHALDRANKKYQDLAQELQVPVGGTLWARLNLHYVNPPTEDENNMAMCRHSINVRVGENTLADVYDEIVTHHKYGVSNITMFRKHGRKLLELTPLSAHLAEFGFEGAPATDESYPAYDVFYEINVFTNSDFIGLGKRMVKGEQTD